MRIILTSPRGKRFMLAPQGNGCGYQVSVANENLGKPMEKGKNKGKIDEREWLPMDLYPWDIPHGLKLIVEKMMSDPEEEVTIEASVKDLKGIERCIQKYLDKITCNIDKEGNANE